jgi:ParB-like chromosome segregation protein Spo0J
MHSSRPSDNAPEQRWREGGADVETPVHYYKIQDLVLLPELNPRAGLCEETIIRYMESFQALPPVNIQEGTGVLVDGFHRVEAARRLGVETIPVKMLDIPDEELHLYAGLANCEHGRALSRTERNKFVVRLSDAYGWSAEKVAKVVGISPSSVGLAIREHRYNKELSERLGEEVQIVNSSHVQALYRVGDEQRSRLLDAIALKTDEDGRPRPLTGSELKLLVDRMEDLGTPAEELRRLLEDPLIRPEAPARRQYANDEKTLAPSSEGREVERRGPLYDGDQRQELLDRAFASDEEFGEGRGRRESGDDTPAWEKEDWSPLRGGDTERTPAPLGLGSPGWGGGAAEPAVALLERNEDADRLALCIREGERVLCDLCSRLEDAELWELAVTARDLVREASDLLKK